MMICNPPCSRWLVDTRASSVLFLDRFSRSAPVLNGSSKLTKRFPIEGTGTKISLVSSDGVDIEKSNELIVRALQQGKTMIQYSPTSQAVDSQVEIKLEAAEKKIAEYAQLIASLYAELKRYQDTICHGCRENVFRATLATSSSANRVHPVPNSVSSASPTLSQSTIPPSDSRQLQVSETPSNTNARGQISGIGQQSSPGFSANSSLLADTSPSIEVMEPAPFISGPSTAPDSIQAKADRHDWSVEYNPEIEQTLRLTLANTFTHNTAKVYCVKFSRDGKYLATGLHNSEIHIYDMITGSKNVLVKRSSPIFSATKKIVANPPQIWTLHFSLDNKYIMGAGGIGEIDIWKIGRRRLCASFKHKAHVRAIDLSPNGRLLVSASYDTSVCLWNLRDGSRRKQWYGFRQFSSVSFHPTGRYIAAGDEVGVLWIWDVRTGQLATQCKISCSVDRMRGLYLRVFFTTDGKRLATARCRTVHFWDFGLRRDAHSRSHHDGLTNVSITSCRIFEVDQHEGSITSISVSSDNRWVVSGCLSSYNNLRILDARNGSWVCGLNGHVDNVWTVDFSPAGAYIASGSGDGIVRLWRYDMLE